MGRKKKNLDSGYLKALQSKNIEWIDLGVKGLKEFIPGLPKGDAILVRGEPGTGKTILCLQFMYTGIKQGETVVYITTEETPETIIRTGKELWDDFPNLVEAKKFIIINLSIDASYASEYSLINKAEAMAIVLKILNEVDNVTRIVVDSLSALERRLADQREFREVFMKLLLETKKRGATTLLSAEGIPVNPGISEYLVDHLIYLDYQKHDVIWTRVFILRKSRSVPLKPQILKLNIGDGGLSVEEIPISLKPVWFASKL